MNCVLGLTVYLHFQQSHFFPYLSSTHFLVRSLVKHISLCHAHIHPVACSRFLSNLILQFDF